MSKINTPMELLRARKEVLEIKSERIVNSLFNTLEYGQDHMGSMVSSSIFGAIYPNLPGFVQRLIDGSTSQRQSQNALKSGAFGLVSDGLLEILPFLLKGKKGFIALFLIKKLKNFFK